MYARSLTCFRVYKIYSNKDGIFVIGINKKENVYQVTELKRRSKEIEIVDHFKLYMKRDYCNYIIRKRLEYICKCEGIFGCIRFLNYPYLYVLIKKEKVGILFDEHKIYNVKNILLIPFVEDIFDNYNEENELIDLFYNNTNHKYIYFSYTYNLTYSVQENYFIQKNYLKGGNVKYKNNPYMWNSYHSKYFIKQNIFLCLSIINGYFIQSKFLCSGKIIDISLVGRRSNKYAGTRFRKRGLNSYGYSANDVESEIILFEKNNSHVILSYTQLRGSVPIFWNQQVNYKILKKPQINFLKTDINYSCTQKHFQRLYEKYGYPITVVNLLSKKKYSDEQKLSYHYKESIDRLNKYIPKKIHIIYKHVDLRKAYKIGIKYTQYILKNVI